jgi:C4-dicarboxylate transporter
MECEREFEIVEAITCGRWPAGTTEELQAHAASCAVCADVVRVAIALTNERTEGLQMARVPSAGLVWWRAEMRARRDAVNRATRPLRIVEWTAVLCMVVALGVVLAWVGPAELAGLLWQPSLAFFIGLGVLILLSSLVYYFVFSGD